MTPGAQQYKLRLQKSCLKVVTCTFTCAARERLVRGGANSKSRCKNLPATLIGIGCQGRKLHSTASTVWRPTVRAASHASQFFTLNGLISDGDAQHVFHAWDALKSNFDYVSKQLTGRNTTEFPTRVEIKFIPA